MPSGVYAIKNTTTGKRYVGSAVCIRRRFENHLRRLRAKAHHSVKLQHAWDRHGSGSFVFEILEIVSDEVALIAVEQRWIDHFRSATQDGYNVNPIANSQQGRVLTPEQRERFSKSQLGRRHKPETKARIGAAHRGKTVSKETRAKISRARIGIRCVYTPEALAKKSAATAASNKARVWTEESRDKLRSARIGSQPDAIQMSEMWQANRKRVECTTLGKTFDSVKDAAAACGLSAAAISNVCAGRFSRARGLSFQFAND